MWRAVSAKCKYRWGRWSTKCKFKRIPSQRLEWPIIPTRPLYICQRQKMKGQTNVRFSAYKIKGKQYLKSVKAKWFFKPLVYLIILLIVFNTHRSSDYSLFVSRTRITLSLMNNNLPNIIITYIAICVSWEFGQLPIVGHHNSLLWRYFLFGSLI